MLLAGKNGLIVGVANKASIAWAIAQAAAREGARLAFNYQNERLRENVEELVAQIPEAKAFACDVSDDAQIGELMKSVEAELGGLDFIVHSVAYAPREELTGEFINTTRAGFATAMDVSVYSLVALARAALPLLRENSSIVTLTYLGGERVVPHYNVMGVAKAALESTVRYLANDLGPRNVRVNAISAGPIRTLAARGVSGINTLAVPLLTGGTLPSQLNRLVQLLLLNGASKPSPLQVNSAASECLASAQTPTVATAQRLAIVGLRCDRARPAWRRRCLSHTILLTPEKSKCGRQLQILGPGRRRREQITPTPPIPALDPLGQSGKLMGSQRFAAFDPSVKARSCPRSTSSSGEAAGRSGSFPRVRSSTAARRRAACVCRSAR